jgi:hypothetical protein
MQPASNTASESVSGRRKQMTMQSDKGGGLSSNLAVQLGILAIVITVYSTAMATATAP